MKSKNKKMSLVGSPLPSVTLFEGSPKDGVNIKDLFGDKKGVLFAVPGAFTPGCSKTHLPGYLGKWDEMKEKGVEIVACVAVNGISSCIFLLILFLQIPL